MSLPDSRGQTPSRGRLRRGRTRGTVPLSGGDSWGQTPFWWGETSGGPPTVWVVDRALELLKDLAEAGWVDSYVAAQDDLLTPLDEVPDTLPHLFVISRKP